MNLLHRLSALAMTAVMAFSISGGVSAADAATATIDTSRSTSLTLYKYDLTGAENDGVWDSQSYVSTGLADEQVNTARASTLFRAWSLPIASWRISVSTRAPRRTVIRKPCRCMPLRRIPRLEARRP